MKRAFECLEEMAAGESLYLHRPQTVDSVCCSVLQCVAAHCSVWQYVAVCCSELQSESDALSNAFNTWLLCVLQCVAACCSTWQYVAVCCSVLQSKSDVHSNVFNRWLLCIFIYLRG